MNYLNRSANTALSSHAKLPWLVALGHVQRLVLGLFGQMFLVQSKSSDCVTKRYYRHCLSRLVMRPGYHLSLEAVLSKSPSKALASPSEQVKADQKSKKQKRRVAKDDCFITVPLDCAVVKQKALRAGIELTVSRLWGKIHATEPIGLSFIWDQPNWNIMSRQLHASFPEGTTPWQRTKGPSKRTILAEHTWILPLSSES